MSASFQSPLPTNDTQTSILTPHTARAGGDSGHAGNFQGGGHDAKPPGSPRSPSTGRPQRTRRAPRIFEAEVNKDDKALKMAINKSLLETRRIKMDYSSLPAVPEVSIESWEEFRVNPISFFENLEHVGREYGAVKIKPPPGWSPPFSLEALTSDQVEFHVRTQDIHSLMRGVAFKHPEEPFHASTLSSIDKQLTHDIFGCDDPDVSNVEAVYWKCVESGAPELTVHYAADLKTNELGSGFPCRSRAPKSEGPQVARTSHHEGEGDCRPCRSGCCTAATDSSCPYIDHPWNLSRLATAEGSLLRHYHRDVPGVTSPWLYVGMIFSSFCWHTEDNFFAACNYHHWGSPKVWYLIPPFRAPSVERMLQSYIVDKDPQYALHSLTVQLPPSLFVENNIPIYRMVQNTGEFIMLWPRTYHAGFNTGFNCNEACNFAPPSWLQWGYKSLRAYRYMRSTCIPYHQLLVRAATHAYDLTGRQMLLLCRAFIRLVLEQYNYRKAANDQDIGATLMHLGDVGVDRVRRIPVGAKGWRREMAGYCRELELLKFPVSIEADSEEVVKLAAAISTLPVKDCCNCRSCCSISCVTCCHLTDHLCMDCSSNYSCSCGQRVVLVRIPLPSLRIIAQQCMETFKARIKQEELEACRDDATNVYTAVIDEGAINDRVITGESATDARKPGYRRVEDEAELLTTGESDVSSPQKKRNNCRVVSKTYAKRRACQSKASVASETKSLWEQLVDDPLYQALPRYDEVLQFEKASHRGVDFFSELAVKSDCGEFRLDITSSHKALVAAIPDTHVGCGNNEATDADTAREDNSPSEVIKQEVVHSNDVDSIDSWDFRDVGGSTDERVGMFSGAEIHQEVMLSKKYERRGRSRVLIESVPSSPVTTEGRRQAVKEYVQDLSWRYLVMTLKEEEEDDDERALPMFKKASSRSASVLQDQNSLNPSKF